MSEKKSKKRAGAAGFRIRRAAASLPAKAFRMTLPGDLACALAKAAAANGVDEAEIVKEALARALKVELRAVLLEAEKAPGAPEAAAGTEA